MDKTIRISVIMPVNLSPYETGSFKSASMPESKFLRSVASFLRQSVKQSELIIISDGCDIAEDIYDEWFIHIPCIQFKKIAKQSPFSGVVRQTGLDMAKGEIICYLDHDDKFGNEHLQVISNNFDTEKYDWVYYNDFLIKDAVHTIKEERDVKPVQSSIGTSAIAHKRDLDVKWGDGYGHDLEMIQKYLIPLPHIKIPTPQYYVCHCSGLKMDF